MTPRMVPARTVREIPSTAMSSSNRFVTRSMTTAASPSGSASAFAVAPVGEGGASNTGGLLGLVGGWAVASGGVVPAADPPRARRDERSIGTAGYRAADAGGWRSFIDIANRVATSLRGKGRPPVMAASRDTRHRAHVPDRPRSEPDGLPDARDVARAAGLRYATDTRPGITRRRSGRGFNYRDADGTTVRDRELLARIRRLAIPPAWTDVWICPWPNGHVQASGRDARGRKQYRYHADWHQRRGADKFDRMLEFATALPRIRKRCDEDLAKSGLVREKVLAAVVRLLELTLIRVGNDEYARLNRSFGLTTLRDRHARIEGTAVRFRFRGKSGQTHEVGLRDRRLAGVVRRCQELPGQELFQFVDEDGEVRDVASDDVNEYIREASGGEYTAKDFRTWAGTVLAYRALRALQPGAGERAA